MTNHWEPLEIDQNIFRRLDGNLLVGNILDQHNGTYSSTNKLKCTILASRYYVAYGACFIRELAKQLAKFKQVQVSVLVPEDTHYNEYEERKAKEIGVTIVKAKKQPGFSESIEWLNYPPADLKTDIVIGVGEELGKVAQNWKMRYQCKSIQFAGGIDWGMEYFDIADCLALSTDRHIKRLRGLSLSADIPVAVGPKTADKLSASLRSKGKQVLGFTPGIISKFSSLTHATKDGTNFRVLFVGGSNPDNFQEDGLELAAKTMAELNDKSYHLICVGAGKETQQQFANFFHQSGVPKRQFEIRNLPQTDEEWNDLFGEVDLAIMPSGDEEFGWEALLALSAGLPVLVHEESGFGKALKDVEFGQAAIVDSDDPKEWASSIKKVRETDRKNRLKQAALLRSNYDEKYSWAKQCGALVAMMSMMASAQDN
ncbi:D-inositol 3-phosphate glycosyltransferase-like [Porites lutea]|uniref:D-inositol 3-phosphate glycosyltransferase-like n=1 Tax=Porites lutea TaxID=51062 RepID=UPI003CC52EC8